jgi:hypothetical protein
MIAPLAALDARLLCTHRIYITREKQGVTDLSYSTSLQSRHQQLEQSIMDEQKRPLPDGLRLQHLKREKLRIKDSMSRL